MKEKIHTVLVNLPQPRHISAHRAQANWVNVFRGEGLNYYKNVTPSSLRRIALVSNKYSTRMMVPIMACEPSGLIQILINTERRQ
jgi:hypothetical protein